MITQLLLSSMLAHASLGSAHFSDSASANAKQKIVHRLQIQKLSDLNFGEASPGDGPKTILAGTTENSENASFEVTGEPYRMYQIILPGNGTVKMINGPGGSNREITINNFNSFPNGVADLNQDGKSQIYVGASRAAISSQQKTGDYLGQFFVTVVY